MLYAKMFCYLLDDNQFSGHSLNPYHTILMSKSEDDELGQKLGKILPIP
jgi:hypothetical protein